jgi:hypothetical protein
VWCWSKIPERVPLRLNAGRSHVAGAIAHETKRFAPLKFPHKESFGENVSGYIYICLSIYLNKMYVFQYDDCNQA